MLYVVLVTLLGICCFPPAFCLTLEAKVDDLTISPRNVAERVSIAFGIEIQRLKLLSATYTPKDLAVVMEALDGSNPTLPELQSVIEISKSSTLANAGLLAVTIQEDAGGFSTSQKMFMVGAASSLVSIIVTIVALAAYKSRSAIAKDTKAKEERAERNKMLYPSVTDSDRMWERIQELESRTALLLSVQQADEEETELKKQVWKSPKKIEIFETESKVEPLPTYSQRVTVHEDVSPATSAEVQQAETLKAWWHRDASEAIEEDHRPPSERYVAAKTKGVLVVEDDVLAQNLARNEVLTGHWSTANPLPPLSLSIGRLIRVEGSNIHGVGLFAKVFIDAGVLLFPYLRTSAGTNPKYYMNHAEMCLRFGADWSNRLGFVCKHPSQDLYCVAEDPAARGWGCLLNSNSNTILEANCEVVWATNASNLPIPWIKTCTAIPPLSELLLSYKVGM